METRTIKDSIECSGAFIFARSTRRFLFLQKRHGKHSNNWVLVGGTNNQGETIFQGLQREIEEELGHVPNILKTIPLEKFVSNDSLFNFHTFFCLVENEFIPILSIEHQAWGWFQLDSPPKPLHKALDLSLRNKIIQTKIQSIIDISDSL